ncbi:MAG: hypothetical protein WBD07_05745 [Vicinamibacterales bacterium]
MATHTTRIAAGNRFVLMPVFLPALCKKTPTHYTTSLRFILLSFVNLASRKSTISNSRTVLYLWRRRRLKLDEWLKTMNDRDDLDALVTELNEAAPRARSSDDQTARLRSWLEQVVASVTTGWQRVQIGTTGARCHTARTMTGRRT